jgi:hypothetical protein
MPEAKSSNTEFGFFGRRGFPLGRARSALEHPNVRVFRFSSAETLPPARSGIRFAISNR